MKLRALSVIGWSGTGKTTLVSKLVRALAAEGRSVGVIKHSSEPHALDTPGSDTARLLAAGAAWSALATGEGIRITRSGALTLAALEELAERVDLVLVEGWKDGPLMKVECFREGAGPLLAATRPEVVAIVSSTPIELPLPCFVPGDVDGLLVLLRARGFR